jgi:signal transduction histidine kinase/DNA-binding response OmpR family regulator
MSMLQYRLDDFISTVPSCPSTATLATVLSIFENCVGTNYSRTECCLVVLNEQELPIGLLYSTRLLPSLLFKQGKQIQGVDLRQQLLALGDSILEPIQTLSAAVSVEEFSQYLNSPINPATNPSNTNIAWAIIDTSNKYLGLLDASRLMNCLLKESLEKTKKAVKSKAKQSSNLAESRQRRKKLSDTSEQINSPNECQSSLHQPFVQLLERLPWPIMLQTSNGEVVTQNPAWWQQLGMLKDPEGIRQEVEAILSSTNNLASHQYPSGMEGQNYCGDVEFDISNKASITMLGDSTTPASSRNTSNRCFLDSELGTCTCVVEVQSGQERVWQFAKIPLDTSDLAALSSGLLGSSQSICTSKHTLRDGVIPEDADLTTLYTRRNAATNPAGVASKHQDGSTKVNSAKKASLQDNLPGIAPKVFSTLKEELQSAGIFSTDLCLMLATDVTEQQQLCKELAAKNADLVQLNRLKDEFLACISHELKTPLTAVLGLSRLLVDQQLGELNERQARYAGLIHQSGRHLMTVVNDILDLTRMETGQMELALGTVNLRSVCDRAVTDAKTNQVQNNKNAPANQTPPSPDHEFTLTIEPDLDEIVADELRLRQMLVHLLSNAFKFTEGGGKIGLRVNRWEGWIAFTVWDTGIGIPEEQQHLIFQKFQQLENPLTRQFEGTGLGLVLTRALARLHGGDVSFLSQSGKGSQFTLLLPPSPPKAGFTDQEVKRWSSFKDGETTLDDNDNYQRQWLSKNAKKTLPNQNHNSQPEIKRSAPNTTTPPQHSPNSSQRLVLVVEAVGRYIEEITEQLTGLGYRVVIARSGCEAVEKARRLQPKAIFVNPLLPLLSGWDVLTLLKSDDVTRSIPTIVTSTGAEKEQAFANRADGFLRLPVQHQILAPLVDSLCHTPEVKKHGKENFAPIAINNPLRILRLVNPDLESTSHPSLPEHRVIEVDDLEQAELLSQVWDFDVVLLDADIPSSHIYLKQLSQNPRLSALPLVTCSVEISQAASQIPELSVFPCLTPFGNSQVGKPNALLSVLQIAAGVSCPPSILVIDLTMLPDLPESQNNYLRNRKLRNTIKNSSMNSEKILFHSSTSTIPSRGSEWFQALIQYLQTAGFKAAMGRSWAELLQQIRHHSVDLLLLDLGESAPSKEVIAAFNVLQKLPFDLPPVLLLDQRLDNADEVDIPIVSGTLESVELAIGRMEDRSLKSIATSILPRSTSMEELLEKIHQALEEGSGE